MSVGSEERRAGDQICCEWRLTNTSEATLAASFYLRARPARLAAVASSSGRILCGRFYASAALLLAAGQTATVTALLEPRAPGKYQLRVAIVTRREVVERLDILIAGARKRVPPMRAANRSPLR